jgi:hypothetical protein
MSEPKSLTDLIEDWRNSACANWPGKRDADAVQAADATHLENVLIRWEQEIEGMTNKEVNKKWLLEKFMGLK